MGGFGTTCGGVMVWIGECTTNAAVDEGYGWIFANVADFAVAVAVLPI